MSDALDWIKDAAKAGQDLRGLIREAHEALRDLRVTLQEVRDVHASIPAAARAALGDRLAEDMQHYHDAYQDAIAGADERIVKRYETLNHDVDTLAQNLDILEGAVKRRLAAGNGWT